MRESLTRGFGVLGALFGSLLLVAPVLALEGDTVADAALGQPDLDSSTCNNGGISAMSLCFPNDVAMDPSTGRLWVVDSGNGRVLGFANANRFASGEAADVVVGQPDFTTSRGSCLAEVAADRVCDALGVAVDRAGRVYVTDSINNRVLRLGTRGPGRAGCD